MNNKGQASIFLVAAVIILLVAGAFSMLTQSNKEMSHTNPLSLAPVSQYVESCLKDTVTEGIYSISLQGGYYQPMHAQVFEDKSVSFYLDASQFSAPTLYTIESELTQYIEDNLPLCIDDFRGLVALEYRIEAGTPSSQTRIGEDEITVLVSYPVTIQQGNEKKELDRFSVSIPFDFKEVYKIIQDIMLQQGSTPNAIPYGFLAYSAYSNDYYFTIYEIDSDIMVYQLEFPSKKLDGKVYKFNFAASYDWAEEGQ